MSYTESPASAEGGSSDVAKTLIYSPNWLGDAVMALPALRQWLAENPASEVSVLCKKPLASFWRMVPGVASVIDIAPGNRGMLATARAIRAMSFARAYIFPNSFRSALTLALAGVPERRGFPRQLRGLLLTSRARPSQCLTRPHQQWEDADILFRNGWNPPDGGLPAPRIAPCAECVAEAFARFRIDPGAKCIGVIPGAARGVSKRWPHFAEAASLILAKRPGLRPVIFGAKNEADVCEATARAIGGGAVSVAGQTSLEEFAGMLSKCAVVLCNDSGGMHLATAVGTPVVAVFGLTDPVKTGPLGRSSVVRRDEVKADRRISRDSPEAVGVLASISPDRVADAAMKYL